jgi:hypothetical protein
MRRKQQWATWVRAVHPALFYAIYCITNSPAERTGLYRIGAGACPTWPDFPVQQTLTLTLTLTVTLILTLTLTLTLTLSN